MPKTIKRLTAVCFAILMLLSFLPSGYAEPSDGSNIQENESVEQGASGKGGPRPKPTPPSSTNVSATVPGAPVYALVNGNFESGMSGWNHWGDSTKDGIAPVISAEAKDGAASILLDNKTNGFTSIWNSSLPVGGQDQEPAAGDLIRIGAWVKLGPGANMSKPFSIRVEGLNGSVKTTIANIGSLAGVKPGTWTYVLSDVGQVPSGQTFLQAVCEDGIPGTLQVDDVKVFHFTTYALTNGNFESGLSGWNQWTDNKKKGMAPAIVSDAKEGAASILLDNPKKGFTSIWNSSLPVGGQDRMPAPGDTIQLGAWVKLGPDADPSKPISIRVEGIAGSAKAAVVNIGSLTGVQQGTWTYVLSNVSQVPVGPIYLQVVCEDGIPGSLQLDDIRVFNYTPKAVVKNSTINPSYFNFDKNLSKQQDIAVQMTLDGNTLTGLTLDTSPLLQGIDYIVSGTKVTISKSYLAKLKSGPKKITFGFNAGAPASLNLNIFDTTPINHPPESLTLPAQYVLVGHTAQYAGSWLAADSDAGDRLTVQNAASDTPSVAAASVSNGVLTVMGIAPGSAKVTANVIDIAGSQTSVTFTVNSVAGEYGLINGTFNLDTSSWGIYTHNSTVPAVVTDAKEGAGSLMLNNGASGFTSMWQTMPLTAAAPAIGDKIQLGAWVKPGNDADQSKDFTIQVESLDSSNAKTLLIHTPSLANLPKNEWSYVTSDVAAVPANAESGTVVSFQDSMPGSIQIDDLRLFHVPDGMIGLEGVHALTLPSQSMTVGQSVYFSGSQLASDLYTGQSLTVTDVTYSGAAGVVGLTVMNGQLIVTGTGAGSATVTAAVNNVQGSSKNVTFVVTVGIAPYIMISPGFEDFTTPENDFSWGIYPSPLYGVGTEKAWIGAGIGIVTDSYNGVSVHGGQKAIGLTSGGALWQRIYRSEGVQDGDIVQTQAWVYAFPGTTGFKLQIDALDAADNHTIIAESRAITADDQGKWVLLNADSVMPVPAGSSDGIVIAANSQSGPILLDDFATSAIGHVTPTAIPTTSGPYYPHLSLYPLRNGDFEDGNAVSLWGTYGNVSITNADAYYGNQSAKFVIDPTTAGNTAIWQGVSLGSGTDDPKAGQGVEAGAWIYLNGDTDLASGNIDVQIESVNASNEKSIIAKTADLATSAPKNQWIYVKTLPVGGGTVPAEASYIQVSVQNTVHGTVYADLVQIGQAGAVNGNPQKMAFFTYQPWYGNPADGGPSDKWYNWNWQGGPAGMNHDPASLTPDGHRDIASVLYPIVGAYDSRDPQLLQYQFDIAKAAHANGFMINDYGRVISQNYRVAENEMFDIADKMGMKLTLQYEPKVYTAGWVDSTLDRAGQINGIKDDLEYILRTYAPRKSFLKYNGIPVINIFGTGLVTNDEWAQILNTIGADGLGSVILMADNAPGSPSSYPAFGSTYNWHMMSSATDPAKSPNYDGVYKWAVGNDKASYSWVKGDLQKRIGVGLVFPGFNDTGVGGNWGAGTPRIADYLAKDDPNHPWMGPADPKGDTLEATQQAVLDGGVNWILYATFNDWNESTVIEPSIQFGYKFMIETKNFLEQFKGLSASDDSMIQTITEKYIQDRTVNYK